MTETNKNKQENKLILKLILTYKSNRVKLKLVVKK